MDEAKYCELVEWAVGVLERSKGGVLVLYNSCRKELDDFALSMVKKIEQINRDRGGRLMNYRHEPYEVKSFPHKVEILDFGKRDLEEIEGTRGLCTIVIDPEGAIGKERKGIDLGFFLNNSHQAA